MHLQNSSNVTSLPLSILYQSADLVAINKPHGLLVHRSPIASDASEFAVQLLRDQLGQRVYPVHRLDRKTGGVLLFALNEWMNSAMQVLFAEGGVYKTYLAIVRGYRPDEQTIEYALRNDETGVFQDAVTYVKTLQRTEIPLPFGKHATSRYRWSNLRLRPAGCTSYGSIWPTPSSATALTAATSRTNSSKSISR